MAGILHLTSGDCAGGLLAEAGLPGEVFVWHDVLYDGPRNPGWPTDDTLQARAQWLEDGTAGGLKQQLVVNTLRRQYEVLSGAGGRERVVLWFDACLFDQAMLAHILTCLRLKDISTVDLLVVDSFPGIDPYDGLGQMTSAQLASVYDRRVPVTPEQFAFAGAVDSAFARQDRAAFSELAAMRDAPLPWVPAAVSRWLCEQADPDSGLERLQRLALDAIRAGKETPAEIMAAVSAADSHPLFWGDITLWSRINALADRTPPLVRINGPAPRLPQWHAGETIKQFRISL
jgi:hypothetical protein